MYRIDLYLRRQAEALEQPAWLHMQGMAETILHIQRILGTLAMILIGAGFVHFLVQGAAKGHVHLLKAPADAEHRNAGLDRRADQRQGEAVAKRIMMSARFARWPTIVMWLDVGRRAGEQQAVEVFQQGRGIDQLVQCRDHQR